MGKRNAQHQTITKVNQMETAKFEMETAKFEMVTGIYSEDPETGDVVITGENKIPVEIEFVTKPDYPPYIRMAITEGDYEIIDWIAHNQMFEKVPQVLEFVGDKGLRNHQSYSIDGIFYIHWLTC